MTNEPESSGGRRVAIIGAGSWGTALALVAARNKHRVELWARNPQVIAAMTQERKNPLHLSSFSLPENVHPTASLDEALRGAGFVFLAVPSHAMRETILQMTEALDPSSILVSCAKGVEIDTMMRMSQVIKMTLAHLFVPNIVALSGPSFALEVARGDPTAVVAAASEGDSHQLVQRAFSSSSFRIYTNEDIIGVELGGAVKNIVAIAAGVVRGLGFGMNSVAAIVTRGLAEISRLAISEGARPDTMAGLAGLGDLVLTCTGDLSRNRHVGIELGKGKKLDQVLTQMHEVAEGVRTTRAIYDLANRRGIDLPITSSVHSLLYEDKSALEAASELMERPLKSE